MADAVILETSFLIDLERELARNIEGPARTFLERQANLRLFVTFTVAGELAAGLETDEREIWSRFLDPFHVLPYSDDVAWQYGQTYRYLRDNGLLIGTNDLWIAATALATELPLVTRNEKHFRRVPGMVVRSYRPK